MEGIMVSWLYNVLRWGIEPSIFFSGARDYARSAVASCTIASVAQLMSSLIGLSFLWLHKIQHLQTD